MGCDIHVMLEYLRYPSEEGRTDYWSAFTCAFNPGRDYSMFEVINGVRGNDSEGLFEKGGLPEDIGYEAKSYFYAGEEGESGEMDADLHSPTWLTCEELAQVIAKRMFHEEWPYSDEWDVLLGTMKAFEERGKKTRLLIAYDN